MHSFFLCESTIFIINNKWHKDSQYSLRLDHGAYQAPYAPMLLVELLMLIMIFIILI